MARDVMAVRLHLPQIRVLEVVEDTPGLTLDAAAQALHTHTTRISALERGLYHNRDLAERLWVP